MALPDYQRSIALSKLVYTNTMSPWDQEFFHEIEDLTSIQEEEQTEFQKWKLRQILLMNNVLSELNHNTETVLALEARCENNYTKGKHFI